MKQLDVRILIGVFLIGAGILFFLQTLNILTNAWGIILPVAFLVGSGLFFYVYITDKRLWWTLIPALTLLGLAGVLFVDTFFSSISSLSGAIFLSSISLGFWVIYLTNREFWWAIIPGGVLLTLAAVTLSEVLFPSGSEGGVFFIGLAVTFALVAILAKPRENFWWAYIPAAILFIMGIFLIGQFQSIFNYIWPVALILFGGFILIRNIRKG